MRSSLRTAQVTIGAEVFAAELRTDLAPRSCEYLLSLLPYYGSVIHARWSGEALWSPLSGVVPKDFTLPRENPRHQSAPGEILLFAGESSEPELFFPYGNSRFASFAGSLQGNPVLTIADRLDALGRLGRDVLWRGAMSLRIEM